LFKVTLNTKTLILNYMSSFIIVCCQIYIFQEEITLLFPFNCKQI
jgi:hypothetical protein